MTILYVMAAIAVLAAVGYGIVSAVNDMSMVNDEKSSCTEADYDLSDKLAAKKN